jgi:hypothetical protein
MQIQDIDFPSDPYCYMPRGFRQIMMSALNKASDHPAAEEMLNKQLGFIVKKLKAIPKDREARAEAVATAAARKAARSNTKEVEQEEGSE